MLPVQGKKENEIPSAIPSYKTLILK
jgi:hypothetical protein